MKKIVLLFFLLFCAGAMFAQNRGIAYQAVIYNMNQSYPGVSIAKPPLIKTPVCLRFSILDGSGKVEYQENISTTTDDFGMVNLYVGNGTQIGGYASSFNGIVWSADRKNMKVELDMSNSCSNFEEISNESLSSVPFAFNSITADNVTGIVAIPNGGTGANTVSGALTNLGLNNVDNTSDANKPVSVATKAALNTKEDASNKSVNIIVDATSDVKYPSVKAIKSYVDSTVANATPADATTATNGIIRLAGDLSGTATAPTVPGLALKEAIANKSTNIVIDATSDVKYPSVKAIKSYVDTTVANATPADATTATNGIIRLAGDLSGTATAPTVPSLLLKEDLTNKSTNVVADATSDVKYPSVKTIKSYVDTTVATATPDADATTKGKVQLAGELGGTAASPTITNAAVIGKVLTGYTSGAGTVSASDTVLQAIQKLDGNTALKAPIASPTFTGTVSGITKSMVGLGNVDNTADLDKPIGTTTQTALDLKADIASPALTGVPTAPTAVVGTNTTQIATTAFVTAAATPDADATTKGKVQLAGELGGTAASPTITNAAVIGKVLTGYTSGAGTVGASDTVLQAIQKLDGNTALKADIASPTFTGTVSGITKAMVGLGNVDNTSDLDKPIGTATQTALDLKADIASPALTGVPTAPTAAAGTNTTQIATTAFVTAAATPDADATTKGKVQLAGELGGTAASPTITNAAVIGKVLTGYTSGAGTVGASDTVLQAIQKLDGNTALKADIASPTFTGTVSGITKAMVGLGNVDNTSDLDKPIGTATQTALDLKADIASPALTGVPTAPTAVVGTNTTQIATTAFVTAAATPDADATTKGKVQLAGELGGTAASPTITNAAVIGKVLTGYTSGAGTVGASDSVLQAIQKLDGNTVLKAPIASPALTGVPTAPTAAVGTNTTQIATTAFVTAAATPDADATTKGKVQLAGELGGTAASPTITNAAVIGKVLTGYTSGAGTVGSSDTVLQAIQKLDGNTALKAPIASPALTGTPTAPTAAVGTNTTQIATTAFVTAATAGTFLPLAGGTMTGDINGTALALNNNGGANTTTIGGGTTTGAITLGGTGTQAINLGTGAGVKTVTLGSNNTTSATTIQGGTSTGAITLTPATAGTIVVGNTAGTGAITIGSSSTAQTTNVGTGAGVSTVNIATGTAANQVQLGGASAQVAIGAAPANASAALEVTSTSKGFLLPRMTTAQRTAITSPATGLQVYDTDTNSIWFRNATTWVDTAATGAGTFLPLAGGTMTGDINGTALTLNYNGGANTTTIGGGATTGAVTIGGTGTQSINLGTGAGAKTVTLGSSNTTSATTIQSGTGAMTFTPATTGAIVMGNTAGTGAITIGSSSAAQTVNIGTGAGTGVSTVNIATGSTTNANLIQLGSTNSQVAIGAAPANASAALEVISTTKGFLPPRMTTVERNAITSPATSLVIFNTTTNELEINTGVPATPVWIPATGVEVLDVIRTQTALDNLILSGSNGFYIVNFANPMGIPNIARGDIILKSASGTSVVYTFANAPASIVQNKTNGTRISWMKSGTSWIGILQEPTLNTDTLSNGWWRLASWEPNFSNGGHDKYLAFMITLTTTGYAGTSVQTLYVTLNSANPLGYAILHLPGSRSGCCDMPFVYFGIDAGNLYGYYSGGTASYNSINANVLLLSSTNVTTPPYVNFSNLGTTTAPSGLAGYLSANGNSGTLANMTAGAMYTASNNSGVAGGRLAYTGETLYGADGTLAGNRIVAQGANTLTFTSTATNGFSVDGTTFSVDAANNKVGIGTIAPDTSAILDLTSTTLGFLLPRMATAQRTAITSPATGLQVYDTDTNSIWFRNATTWVDTAAGATGAFLPLAGGTMTGDINGTALTLNNNGGANTTTIGGGTTTGAVTIGGTGTQSINLGTGAGAKTVTLGSSNTTSATTIQSGTGAMTFTPATTGAIVMGNTAGTGAITIGSSSAAQTVNIGTGAGTGVSTVNIATGSTTNANLIQLGSTNSQVAIGAAPANASAALEVTSTTKGFLPPRMTTTQRGALTSPATGLTIYNTSTNTMDVNTGTAAVPVWANLNAKDYFFGSITSGQNLNTGGANLNISQNVARGVSISGNTITLRANRVYSITAAIAITSTDTDRGTMAIVNSTTGNALGSTAILVTKPYSNQVGLSTSEAIVAVGTTNLTINVRVMTNIAATIDNYSDASYIKITEL